MGSTWQEALWIGPQFPVRSIAQIGCNDSGIQAKEWANKQEFSLRSLCAQLPSIWVMMMMRNQSLTVDGWMCVCVCSGTGRESGSLPLPHSMFVMMATRMTEQLHCVRDSIRSRPVICPPSHSDWWNTEFGCNNRTTRGTFGQKLQHHSSSLVSGGGGGGEEDSFHNWTLARPWEVVGEGVEMIELYQSIAVYWVPQKRKFSASGNCLGRKFICFSLPTR